MSAPEPNGPFSSGSFMIASWDCSAFARMALESAMARAIGLWYAYPQEFRYLQLNGMRADHAWTWPAQHYVDIYQHIRHK